MHARFLSRPIGPSAFIVTSLAYSRPILPRYAPTFRISPALVRHVGAACYCLYTLVAALTHSANEPSGECRAMRVPSAGMRSGKGWREGALLCERTAFRHGRGAARSAQ